MSYLEKKQKGHCKKGHYNIERLFLGIVIAFFIMAISLQIFPNAEMGSWPKFSQPGNFLTGAAIIDSNVDFSSPKTYLIAASITAIILLLVLIILGHHFIKKFRNKRYPSLPEVPIPATFAESKPSKAKPKEIKSLNEEMDDINLKLEKLKQAKTWEAKLVINKLPQPIEMPVPVKKRMPIKPLVLETPVKPQLDEELTNIKVRLSRLDSPQEHFEVTEIPPFEKKLIVPEKNKIPEKQREPITRPAKPKPEAESKKEAKLKEIKPKEVKEVKESTEDKMEQYLEDLEQIEKEIRRTKK